MAHEGDGWQGYDRIFRQHAAVRPSCKWANIDGRLWNVAFARKTMVPHCKYCFSFSHSSTECAWANDHSAQRGISNPQPSDRGQCNSPTTYNPNAGQHRRRICFAWNNHPYPGCPFPSCSFEHSCPHCMNYPYILDKCHKARFCPYQSLAEHNCGPNFNQ